MIIITLFRAGQNTITEWVHLNSSKLQVAMATSVPSEKDPSIVFYRESKTCTFQWETSNHEWMKPACLPVWEAWTGNYEPSDSPWNLLVFQMTTVLSTLQEASHMSHGAHARSKTSVRDKNRHYLLVRETSKHEWNTSVTDKNRHYLLVRETSKHEWNTSVTDKNRHYLLVRETSKHEWNTSVTDKNRHYLLVRETSKHEWNTSVTDKNRHYLLVRETSKHEWNTSVTDKNRHYLLVRETSKHMNEITRSPIIN